MRAATSTSGGYLAGCLEALGNSLVFEIAQLLADYLNGFPQRRLRLLRGLLQQRFHEPDQLSFNPFGLLAFGWSDQLGHALEDVQRLGTEVPIMAQKTQQFERIRFQHAGIAASRSCSHHVLIPESAQLVEISD